MCACHWDDEALADCRNGDCREQAENQRRVDDAEAAADMKYDIERDEKFLRREER
jgi:hypothetical protein